MSFLDTLIQIFNEIVVAGHPALIHFPIIGTLMGAVAGVSAWILAIFLYYTISMNRLFKKLEGGDLLPSYTGKDERQIIDKVRQNMLDKEINFLNRFRMGRNRIDQDFKHFAIQIIDDTFETAAEDGMVFNDEIKIKKDLLTEVVNLANWKDVNTRIQLARRFTDRFEFTSWIMIIMGEVGLMVAAFTGFQSAGGVDAAVSNDYLAYKIELSIYTFFLLLVPIMLKLYMELFVNAGIFEKSRVIPVLYLMPMIVSAILIVLISGAGGRYVYGHTLLDFVGLGWLLPGSGPA